ncbi:tetratricopeptide repeat protein [Streptomyces sp. NPDC050617]|uniref:tetratricopeptide repeat protein n=1 Tax=Streptomyces sp. NPDC050617 TaxID=3154628 RepID=UPI003435FEF3
MTAARSREDIRFDIFELDDEPFGAARNARAAELTAEAEATGHRPLLVEALVQLTIAYSTSAECDKMFVPFARLLRMWDENPADFDEDDTHQLFWMFKWVTGDALAQPQIPLDSIEQWLPEMRRRYRIAGHSERPVHSRDLDIARHLGDRERGDRALAAMLAADRDNMSDCHACELRTQGLWEMENGDDAAGVEAWRPVTDGEEDCLTEPHRTLAYSLLPLVRLGRLDDARSHHLRGYRLARSEDGLSSAVASHVEFCALTGNEPRGLEILAEQTPRWELRGDVEPHMHWLACAALLMRRLVELGHGDRPVPGPPGSQWTAATLLSHTREGALAHAARFDARNGSTRVSDLIKARMAAEPLVDGLVLGVRTAALGTGAGAGVSTGVGTGVGAGTGVGTGAGAGTGVGTGAGAGTGVGTGVSTASGAGTREGAAAFDGGAREPAEEPPAALVEKARRLTESAHPAAGAAWQRAAAAVARAGDVLSTADRADLLDTTGLEIGRSAGRSEAEETSAEALFAEAAGLHDEAGRPGRAVVARARALLSSPDLTVDNDTLALLGELGAQVDALHAAGRATAAETLAVHMFRCRIRAALVGSAADPAAEAADVSTGLERLIAFAEQHLDDPAVLSRVANATELLGRLTAPRDLPAAVELLGTAVARHHASGRPWFATTAEIQLAQAHLAQGDHGKAAALVRTVLDDPERVALLEPGDRARLCMALFEAVAGGRREGEGPSDGTEPVTDAECATLLLDAAHFADRADETATLGALARLRLGGHYCTSGRHHEAASILESVLPDLAEGHDESDRVQAHVWLAHSYGHTGGEPGRAAEQFILAADIAKGWDDQHHHAILSHQAAEALGQAGMAAEAAQAFERAEQLWRGLGDSGAAIRSLRARAWETLRSKGQEDADAVMREALRENEEGARAAEAAPDPSASGVDELRHELGRTHEQMARVCLERTDGAPDKEYDSPEQYAVNVAAFEEALGHMGRAVEVFRRCGEKALADCARGELLMGRLEFALGRFEEAADRARRARATVRGVPDPDGSLMSFAEECNALILNTQRNRPGR